MLRVHAYERLVWSAVCPHCLEEIDLDDDFDIDDGVEYEASCFECGALFIVAIHEKDLPK